MRHPLDPPTITTEEEWRQFRVLHMYQQTRHLDKIRTYTGWLLGLVVAGIVLSFFMGMAAANSSPYGY
jgi:hypothetical protein